MAVETPQPSAPPSNGSVSDFNTDMLRVYYGRLFPYSEMYQWLAYGNDRKHPGSDQSFFSRREFSFTLEHDIYVRYQSFGDAAQMESSIRDKCPHKIDIGAVYNVDPSRRTAYQGGSGADGAFSPVERELVFDVDMTDYDDVRSCCSGADICHKCWPLMTIAIKVVHTALQEDFGFCHILWVYSGRRGVHCWVCDEGARRLTNEQRTSVAEYFRVYKGGEHKEKKVAFDGPSLHPALLRAYEDVLKGFFEGTVGPAQRVLGPKKGREQLLATVPDEDVRDRLSSKWDDDRWGEGEAEEETFQSRWKQLESAIKAGAKKNPALRQTVEETVFAHTYPRLDLEVSKHMNHLLKAPFCVHPKTGRVCVPIDPSTCEQFDPLAVPSLSQLITELNESQPMDTDQRDLERTSMHAAVETFKATFLNDLVQQNKEAVEAKHKEDVRAKVAAPTVQW